jgi:hypothetical protein
MADNYISNIGMEGCVRGRKGGTVNVDRADERHGTWLHQEAASGIMPSSRLGYLAGAG